MSDSPSYRTLQAPLRHEIAKIKGSRFLACIAPCQDRDAAASFVESIRREFHDARHVCSAWRLGLGDQDFRFDDDGEPNGSAGRPILQQIDGHGLSNCVVAVVRWFGGTKLGVGGLVRAYGQAAAEALGRAEIETVVLKERILVRFPYELSGPMQGLCAALDIQPSSSEYGTEVELSFDIPLADCERFVHEVTERSAARAQIERPESG